MSFALQKDTGGRGTTIYTAAGQGTALIVVPLGRHQPLDNMYFKIAVLLAVAAVAHAGIVAPVFAPTTLVRTPSHDSAIIKSERLGGNFAYSTVEGHAYASISPVVQNVVAPVAVSYSAHPYTISHPGLIIH